MVKTALAAICALSLLATAYLTASLAYPRPPRANYQQWTLVAAVILVQGALTLFALRADSPKGLRYVAAAGGAAIAALGASSVYSTVSGDAFRGLRTRPRIHAGHPGTADADHVRGSFRLARPHNCGTDERRATQNQRHVWSASDRTPVQTPL